MLLALSYALLAAAHGGSDDADMSGMDMTGSDATGSMLAYLHFGPTGDLLWFRGWVPTRVGPMVGVCIGLFLLAVFERWLAACRAVAERSWARS
jgi:solute carrier family 31 (copper transporter), member 1